MTTISTTTTVSRITKTTTSTTIITTTKTTTPTATGAIVDDSAQEIVASATSTSLPFLLLKIGVNKWRHRSDLHQGLDGMETLGTFICFCFFFFSF